MKTLLTAILITLPLTASADYYQDYANYQKQLLIQQQQLLKIQQQNQAEVQKYRQQELSQQYENQNRVLQIQQQNQAQMYRQQEQRSRQYQNQYLTPYSGGNERHYYNNNGWGYNNRDRD